MPVYEIEAEGKTFEIEAPDIKKALPVARLYIAKQRMIEQVESGAIRRSNAPDLSRPMSLAEARREVQESRERHAEKLPASATPLALSYIAGAATVPSLVASLIKSPVATTTGLAAAYGGSKVGGEVGGRGGRLAEDLGAPKGTAKVLRTVGELGGAAAGGFGGPKAIASLRNVATNTVERAALEAAAAKAVPQAVAAAEAAPVAQAAPVVQSVSKAAAQAEEISAKILEWKMKNGWSGAQIISALRNVYGISPKDGRAMIHLILESNAAKAAPLQAERIQIGAQNVARALGTTKEEIRKQAGPVLGEALGEASPILPKKALQSIIDTMKAMPMAEREAYVARATSGKAQWQIENIRRTLEHLGLLLPAGVAAGIAAKE